MHRRVMWLLLALPALAWTSLSACTEGEAQITLGREFPIERAVALKKGSSKREVEDILGPPWRVSQEAGRREKWRYYVRIERPQYVLLVIQKNVQVTENELTLVFEGNFVDTHEKNIQNYLE